jgi:hypothetical protein
VIVLTKEKKFQQSTEKWSQLNSEVIEEFAAFAENDIFSNIAEFIECERVGLYETHSHLNLKYLFCFGHTEMTFILMGERNSDGTAIHTDYLRGSYGFIEGTELLSHIKVFEGDFPQFKKTFDFLIANAQLRDTARKWAKRNDSHFRN